MVTKKAIRQKIFNRREEYTQENIESLSHKIFRNFISAEEYIDAERIYIYIDCKKEVSTREIIESAWTDGKEIAVPKVDGQNMIFYKLESYDQLEEGYYHIMEPTRGEIISWEDALMVMPGVAFDKQCHRIGYGGGFYDRFLEIHRLSTIALAFEFQMMDEVPCEITDILPDKIITEDTVYIHS